MGKWKIYTPNGMQDILFNECYVKKNLENKLRQSFKQNGYMELETPTVEFYDVFSSEVSLLPQEHMFKFTDQQGRLLTLRPDQTIPVARVAATRIKNIKAPIRCSYISNSFCYNERQGRQKEYTQAGIEILGASCPEADAEVIAMAIKSVLASGIEEFQIDIGQVEFFRGLMDETGLSEEEIENVRSYIDSKDFVGVEKIVESHNILPKIKEIILNLPTYFGSIEIIEKLEKLNINKRAIDALENLRSILNILDDYGYSKYVSIDLGMVPSLKYYTGIIFRGMTYGVGFPLLSGGRYDSLVEIYGNDISAIGFSIEIDLLMKAIKSQKIKTLKPGVDSIIIYKKSARKAAFILAEHLRSKGLSIEMDVRGMTLDEAKEYIKSKNVYSILNVIDEQRIEVYDSINNTVKKSSMDQELKG